jgi:hypothetical protein
MCLLQEPRSIFEFEYFNSLLGSEIRVFLWLKFDLAVCVFVCACVAFLCVCVRV